MLGRLCIAYLKAKGVEIAKPRPDYLYDEDAITTSRNHDFVGTPEFLRAQHFSMGPLEKKHGAHGRWNLHVYCWAGAHAVAMGADIVALGVFSGSQAAGIAAFTDFAHCKSQMFLVDTFTGVPEEQWSAAERVAGADSAQHLYHAQSGLAAYVRERFASYPNIHVIEGAVPDILPAVKTNRIGLLILDMNAAFPERAGLEYFWEHIAPGGMVVSDDYGHSREGAGFIEQKIAFDTFARSVGVEVLSLPTGHGVIIKV